jgi:hypothetical protein
MALDPEGATALACPIEAHLNFTGSVRLDPKGGFDLVNVA